MTATATALVNVEPWMIDAECLPGRSENPDLWFPVKGGTPNRAKSVCAGCTVRRPCLIFALLNDDRYGVWGGLSPRQRADFIYKAGGLQAAIDGLKDGTLQVPPIRLNYGSTPKIQPRQGVSSAA